MAPRLQTLRAGLLCLMLGAVGLAGAEPQTWSALTPLQRQALAPLQRDWAAIDPAGKEKWLEMAARFPAMSTAERQLLQERMQDWARMTPEQRSRARLQYQETRLLPTDEKRARWEAYQSLSEEERKSLIQRSRPPARSTAGAEGGPRTRSQANGSTAKNNLVVPRSTPRAQAVSPSLVTTRPGATTTTVTTPAAPPLHHQPGVPKIAATPDFVDPATLLPKRGPQGAAVSPTTASAPTQGR